MPFLYTIAPPLATQSPVTLETKRKKTKKPCSSRKHPPQATYYSIKTPAGGGQEPSPLLNTNFCPQPKTQTTRYSREHISHSTALTQVTHQSSTFIHCPKPLSRKTVLCIRSSFSSPSTFHSYIPILCHNVLSCEFWLVDGRDCVLCM